MQGTGSVTTERLLIQDKKCFWVGIVWTYHSGITFRLFLDLGRASLIKSEALAGPRNTRGIYCSVCSSANFVLESWTCLQMIIYGASATMLSVYKCMGVVCVHRGNLQWTSKPPNAAHASELPSPTISPTNFRYPCLRIGAVYAIAPICLFYG